MTDNLSEEEQQQRQAAEKYKETVIDIESKLFDKSSAYNNLIMVGGYAATFALWSQTKFYLPEWATLTTALLLCLSITVFIAFQVYKMARGICRYWRLRKILYSQMVLSEMFEKMSELNKAGDRSDLSSVAFWSALTLFICVTTGLGAMGILGYYFVFTLLNTHSLLT